MPWLPRALRDEKGVAFAAFAILAVATVGLASLGLGTGLLFLVHTEAQNASDAGALAGVEALFFGSSVDLEARDAVKDNILSRGIDNPGAGFATDANIVSISTGNYAPATGAFVSGLPPQNAVEVVVETDIAPMFRGDPVLGNIVSTVRTRSVAAWSGVSQSLPALPILVGACEFTPRACEEGFDCTDDSCMPTITGAGATDPQVRWTSLKTSPANRANVMATFPSACQAFPECFGAAGAATTIAVEDVINVMADGTGIGGLSGNESILLRCAQACFSGGGVQQFQVPIVSCEIGATATVCGFATFEVNPAAIVNQVGQPNPGMTLVGRVVPPGETGGGGSFFGTPVITLVQ